MSKAIDDEGLPERALIDIKEEKLEWLWYPYIPFEMVTNLEGEGQIGKSRLTRYIAARVTKGLTLPGQKEDPPPGNVLVVSFSEDPVPSVVRPQIRKMGGDLKKVFVVERPFTLDEDGVKLLDGVMERIEPSLVIFDPLTDYIPSRTNSYKDEEVRRMVMGPLTGLAKEHSCAILAIRHFTKGGGGPLKYRGGGSVAFANVSRSTIACVEDPYDDHITVMGPSKANLVPKDNLVFRRFQIEKTEDGIGRLVWRGTSDKTLDQLEVERSKANRDIAELEKDAKEWLLERLGKGEVPVKELRAKAEGKSFSWSTVERAKRNTPEIQSRGGYRGNPAIWYIDDEKH
jgi:RecA-family ATPase